MRFSFPRAGQHLEFVLRLLACCALASLLGAGVGNAEPTQALPVAIAPQPMADALTEFARQTGLQLVYLSEVARARASKGAPAGLAPGDALTQLLEGTGLGFEFLNPRTVRIFERVAVAPTAQTATVDATRRNVERRTNPSVSWSDLIVMGTRDEQQESAAEAFQTAAVSATVVSAARLERQELEQLSDYAPYLPGLNIGGGNTAGQSGVSLRGIGSWSGASVVGYYIDDTPIGPTGPYGFASAFPLDLAPYDLDHVEVLRGPQGTLYGAASEVGLIKYTLRAPSVTDFETRVGADVGLIHGASRPDGVLRAMVNAPLIADALGLRISVFDSYTAGYIDNAQTGARNVNATRREGGRIAGLWSPTESVTVKFNALWNEFQSASLVGTTAPGVTTLPTADGSFVGAPVGTSSGLVEFTFFESPFRKSIAYYSASVRWNPGLIEILSATAWSGIRTHFVEDVTVGSGGPQLLGGPPGLAKSVTDLRLGKFTQELRASSPPGPPLEWVLGAFFSHEASQNMLNSFAFDTSYRPNTALDPYLNHFALPATYKEWAVFGDLTWRVTEQVDVTGGIRRAHDDQNYTAIFYASPDQPTQYQPGHSAERVGTWLATARYRVTPDVMLYARAATGYQPGFAQSPTLLAADSTPFVKPESLVDYEVGLKSTFLDGRARANLTVFHILQHNVQIETPPGFTSSDTNGESVTAKGAEVESSYTPMPGLRFAYTATYTQSQPTFDPNGCCVLPVYQSSNVPKWTMSLTIDHDWSVEGAWRAHVSSALRWVSWAWNSSVSYSPPPSVVLPSYTVLDLNAGLTNGRIAVRAFARNVTDKRAYLSGNVLTDWTGLVAQQINYVLLQPRTLGIGVDYAF